MCYQYIVESRVSSGHKDRSKSVDVFNSVDDAYLKYKDKIDCALVYYDMNGDDDSVTYVYVYRVKSLGMSDGSEIFSSRLICHVAVAANAYHEHVLKD